MKPTIKSFKALLLCAVAAIFSTSCEDMLTPDSDTITTEFGGDSLYSYWGIVSSIQDVMSRTYIIGESRGDLVMSSDYTSDSVSAIANFDNPENGSSKLVNLADYYQVINLCNFYLHNADTTRTYYGVKVNKKEYAQVQVLRAWMYMNLVNIYGSVPFLTTPINETNTKIENTAERVDRTNLIDKLNEAGFADALYLQELYGLPANGSFNIGAGTISSARMAIDGRLVAADLYLMRGASTSDYEQAATYYFEFFTDNSISSYDYAGSVSTYSVYTGGIQTSRSYSRSYSSLRSGYGLYTTPVVQSLIPIAASRFFGKVTTELANTYGYSTTARNVTTTENDTTVSSAAYITITATEKMRQLAPSSAYERLAASQPFIYRNTSGSTTYYEELDEVGDTRFYAAAPYVRTDAGDMRFVGKITSMSGSSDLLYPSSFTFHYAFNLYRYTQIVLRYAEAINRAGYPYHAFALLRNGMKSTYLPTYTVGTELDSIGTVLTTAGTDSIIYDTLTTYTAVTASDDRAITYISVDELYRAQGKSYLAFAQNTSVWLPAIHALGSGSSLPLAPDSLFNPLTEAAKKYTQEASRVSALSGGTVPTISDTLRLKSYDTNFTSADPALINYVEDIICDEMALELGFDGNRYFDLLRIAGHKNNDSNFGSDFGTSWMAWKIARRSYDLAPYANPTQYDATLYSRLSSSSNWYLPLPTYY